MCIIRARAASALFAALLAVAGAYAHGGASASSPTEHPPSQIATVARGAETGSARTKGKTTVVPAGSIDWAVRVIPLPHEMQIGEGVEAPAGDIGVLPPVGMSPQVETALELLRSFALGDDGSSCRIRLVLRDGPSAAAPRALWSRLSSLPNADQAYAIVGKQRANGRTELVLAANTPLGLLYAARTLRQLVAPPAAVTIDTRLVLPLGEIVDWPDIPDRGQWGEESEDDLAWMSQWKLNHVEVDAHANCDAEGRPIIRMPAGRFADGAKLGVTVVPFLSHLEQLGRRSLKGWEDCFNVPSPDRAKRSDYYPSLCMSKPRTHELIARWLKQIAAVPGVRDIMVWLSEEATQCCCDQCKGKDPYVLEATAVLAAFRETQAQANPNLRLRVLTSQGSYPVNDKVIAVLPPDVQLTYYDGSRTYDSSHAPMIYPLLEQFARSGRRLGVYPQITNAWGTVLPWTGPQFIQARMTEFARKHLSSVVCYAVPSHHFHMFNCVASGEWSWNHAGRTPREFARAFAHAAGIEDIDAFAQWAESIGPVGWDIAGTKLFLRMMYDPSLGLGEAVPLDHRFEGGPEVVPADQIELDLAQARTALGIARSMNLADAIDESEITIASVKLLGALYRLSHAPADRSQASVAEIAAASDDLETLDQASAIINARLRRWGGRISAQIHETLPGRLVGSAHIGLRTAGVVREIIGARLGIPDPHPEFRYHEIGGWSAKDFASGPRQTLTFDATEFITQPGDYAVCLDFVESAYGFDANDVRIVASDGQGRRQAITTSDPIGGVSMWSRRRDMTFAVPEILPGCRYRVEIDARGLPADAPPDRQTCTGKVGIRRNFPASAVPDVFFAE